MIETERGVYYTRAEIRAIIKEALQVHAAIEIEYLRQGVIEDADTLSMRITKKNARRLISDLTDKGDLVLGMWDGTLLVLTT